MDAQGKLIAFTRQYPEAKSMYKKMQKWQIENNPPNGIFYPMRKIASDSDVIREGVMTGVVKALPIQLMNDQQLHYLRYMNGLMLFGAWRNTLGVYRIDSEIFEEIIKSPIPLATPVDIFKRLPEWCVYVEFPRPMNDTKQNFKGFWAYFSEVPNNKGSKQAAQLHFVLDFCEEGKPFFDGYFTISLMVDEGLTVSEAIENLSFMYEDEKEAQKDAKLLCQLLPLLLWLCAEDPDITDFDGEPVSNEELRKPKYGRNKKTGTFIPPNEPIIYNLGQRLGGEIRNFEEHIKSFDQEKEAKLKPASLKRPHVRRGHLHGYWCGSENKTFEVRWLKATFVNGSGGNTL